MKSKLIAFAVIVALCLSGCGWMDGSFVSVTPHQVDYGKSGDDVPSVSSYSELRTALTALIDAGEERGLFSLVDYSTDDALLDMEAAARYATQVYPIGAYAVESIRYDVGTGLGTNALSVEITYSHTGAELASIQTVRGISGAQNAVSDALDNCQDSLVLQITGYRETDFVQMVAKYAAQNPDEVMETPQVTVSVYPDQGDTRVVELEFGYQNSREQLRDMQSKVKPVFSSAALYVSGEADQRTQFNQLFTFLTERFDYSIQTSVTPSYSLLCEGIGDSRAFSQVYAAMCSRIGLEAITVSGTHDGDSRSWNIVCVDGVYYHLDLLACTRDGKFTLRTDRQMEGYTWDTDAYPACGQTE